MPGEGHHGPEVLGVVERGGQGGVAEDVGCEFRVDLSCVRHDQRPLPDGVRVDMVTETAREVQPFPRWPASSSRRMGWTGRVAVLARLPVTVDQSIVRSKRSHSAVAISVRRRPKIEAQEYRRAVWSPAAGGLLEAGRVVG